MTIYCPRCDGYGTIENDDGLVYGSDEICCPDCNGTGYTGSSVPESKGFSKSARREFFRKCPPF